MMQFYNIPGRGNRQQPQPKKVSFNLTGQQVVINKLKEKILSRQKDLIHFRQIQEVQKPQKLPQDPQRQRAFMQMKNHMNLLNSKGKGMQQPEQDPQSPSHYEIDEIQGRYNHQRPPHFFCLNTISSFKDRISNKFNAFQEKVGKNSDFQNFKHLGLQHIQKDLGQLAYFLKRQNDKMSKIQQSPSQNNINQYLQLFGEKNKIFSRIQSSVDSLLQNMYKIFDQKCKKFESEIKSRTKMLHSIQQKYFNYIKYRLVIIALQERLPKHGVMKYDKIDQKSLNYQNVQQLSSNNVSSMYRTIFSQKTFSGLQDGNWLHNSVIDNYIQYLKFTRGFNDSTRSNCAIYSFSQSKRFQLADSYRFLSGPIFTNFSRVGLVINVEDKHWFFIGVIPKKGKFIIYDSIAHRKQFYDPYLTSIRKLILKEETEFKLQQGNIVLTQISEETTPTQINGYDCGLHVILNLTYFLHQRGDKNQVITFQTSHIKYLRAALYHFMAYLLYLSRDGKTPNYDWLQFSSCSVMLNKQKKGHLMWR